MSTKNKIFLTLFILDSVLLLLGSWFHAVPFSILEDLGFISGGATVWLIVVENIWNFPIGILNDVFFLILFYQASLFADAWLQVLYVILGIQGWYLWARKKNNTTLKISNSPFLETFITILLVLLGTWVLTIYLGSIKDSAPFWDALTTALSVAGQWFLNKKYIQNWAFWILADLIYIPLYVTQHLNLTAVVYILFLLMCLFGVREWRKIFKIKMEVVK